MASLKARDIQAKLQHTHDPKLVNILCALAERDDTLNKQNLAMAEAYDRLVNMFQRVIQGVGGMGGDVKKMMLRMGFSSAADDVKSLEAEDEQQNATNFMEGKTK